MKQRLLIYVWLGMGLCSATVGLAHSERAVREIFSQAAIPEDVAEATRQFESTAGTSGSLRASAHAKQHQLLEQYFQAGWRRTCADSQALLPSLDEAIRLTRDTGDLARESELRRKRDEVAGIILDTCSDSGVDLSLQP